MMAVGNRRGSQPHWPATEQGCRPTPAGEPTISALQAEPTGDAVWSLGEDLTDLFQSRVNGLSDKVEECRGALF